MRSLERRDTGQSYSDFLKDLATAEGLPTPTKMNRPARQAMHSMVRTVCAKASVPRVCTHSLCGLWATLAVKSGAVSHAVAASLVHHSFAVTQEHYAEPEAITNAATARALDRLAPSSDPERPSARELLDRLDADTIEQLTELLNARNPKGRGGN